jgi:transcriptional regulator with PAS, ATPase and Fis domain
MPPRLSTDHADLVAQLLATTRDIDDEREALAAAARLVRQHSAAIAAAVCAGSATQIAAVATHGTVSQDMGRRCLELCDAIGPERTDGGIEAAVPIHCLGHVPGAIVCRWTVEGPESAHEALGIMRVAAAVCAPLVHILAERSKAPAETPADHPELVGVSAEIQEVRRLITRAALAPFTVLIEGESGAGKELVAQAIHRTSHRRARAFCPLNCAALTEDLVDVELFGHVKGAFTGAAYDRVGLFEGAAGGSVFLDEVGELSARAQAKLLRVLQEGEIRRIGENFARRVDARLIAATNRSLRADVDAGRFRQDLYYRLDVIRISVPPLRDRAEDIPLLAARFWRQATERIGSRAVLGQSAVASLARYDWPGNVRELHNVLTALAVAAPRRGVVSGSAMPAAIARTARLNERETLEQARQRFEVRFVRAALARTAGHRGQTAAALGVSRQGLAKLMHRLQIHGL